MQFSAVVNERQIEISMRQCDSGELLADVAEFRVGGPQELAACRGLVEEIADLDHRAEVTAARGDGAFVAAIASPRNPSVAI